MVRHTDRDLIAYGVVALFLCSAVAANLAVARWGQVALVFTAWVLIPFDLVTRDILHERWHRSRSNGILWAKMAGLILCGSALTAAASWDAKQIAIASFLGFAAAGTTNTLVYHALWHRSRYFRMNGSNLFAACADSIVFPVVAFGITGTSFALCAAQAASKFTGGLIWSAAFLYIARRLKR